MSSTGRPGPAAVRILADDLTGALDTGAEFVSAFGPLRVSWSTSAAAAVVDIGIREEDAAAASDRTEPMVGWLGEGAIAFQKIDSLLRGPWAASLGVLMSSGVWRTCVL